MKGQKSLSIFFLAVIVLLTFSTSSFADDSADLSGVNYLSRMFISPTGKMIPSGVINIAFGGAFTSQGGREYLGLFSVGLGGVAEFEVSTSHILTNIFNTSEPVGTSALKFILYKGKPLTAIPSVAVGLRSNRWSDFEGGRDELAGPAEDHQDPSIHSVDFEVHLTSLYLCATSEISSSFTLHGGLMWNEVRTRAVNIVPSTTSANTPLPEDMQSGKVSFILGIEHEVKNHTFSMFELSSQSKIEFDRTLLNMTLKQVTYAMAGVRFYITPLTSIDTGFRFRSDFAGLADVEIRAGLNFGFNVTKAIQDKMKDR